MTVSGNDNPIKPHSVENPANIQIACDRLLDINWDGHGQFRGLCLVYGDFYRPVLLHEFVRWFVRNANKTELGFLAGKIAARRAQIRRDKKRRGRPRAEEDPNWLGKARDAALKHLVDGLKWRQIAELEGLKPTKANFRTLQNRENRYAGIIWEVCSEAGIWRIGAEENEDMERLKNSLESKSVRMLFCRRALLPFDIIPGIDLTAKCKEIVLILAPRGRRTVAKQIVRICKRHKRL